MSIDRRKCLGEFYNWRKGIIQNFRNKEPIKLAKASMARLLDKGPSLKRDVY